MNETLCRRIVRERSAVACEIRNLTVCHGRATNASHRKARSQGGEWTPSNILDACGSGTTGCHGWIEHNPQEALRYGFRVQHHDNPLDVTVLHAAHGWVWLLDDGTTRPFIRPASYSEPDGWANRATYTDPTAPHQIRLQQIGSDFTVSCTCNRWRQILIGPDEIAAAATIHRTEHLHTQTPIEQVHR